MSGAARIGPLLNLLRSLPLPRRRLLASTLLGAGAVLAAVGLLSVSGYLVSRAAQRPEILALTVALVGVRLFSLLRASLRYGERLVSHDMALRALGELRVRFFSALVPLVPGGLGRRGRAELLSRFVADVDRLQDLYLRALLPALVALLAGSASVLIAFLLYPPAAGVLAGFLLAGGLVVSWLGRRAAREAGRRQAAARAALTTALVETAGGAAEIALAGRESDWLARVKTCDRALVAIGRRDAAAAGLGNGLGVTLAAGAAVAMVAVTLPAVSDGSVAGVLLAAIALLGLASYEAVAPLPAAAASVDACATAAGRLEELTSVQRPIPEPPASGPEPADGPLHASGVNFGYEPGSCLLEDLELRLAGGESVAISGPSGAGKSTIAELLARFLEPQSGSISLGGVELGRLSEERLRGLVLLSAQDSYVFALSLRENLLIGNPRADDEALIGALGRVGLGPWLADLPGGLGAELGEAGANVSGGQRQRIAAARALLSPARFLIFDEPTAHLDREGAEALLAELAREAHLSGRGVLVITHETAGLDRFDRSLTLGAGRLG